MHCARCGGQLKTTDTREVMDGKVYHLFCHWKLNREKEELNADKVREEQRSADGV